VLKSNLIPGLLVVCALAFPTIAAAQTPEAGSEITAPTTANSNLEAGRDTRVAEGRNTRLPDRRQQGRQARPAAPTAEEIAAEATAIAAVAAPSCQVTGSALLGAREDGTKLYEVACASGPGYMLEAIADAPKANDCVLQWSFGQIVRESDPAADVGLQCGLPANQNAVQVIAAYGRDAGLECQVDQALATAQDVYEIGCADRDGWRVEKQASGWQTTPCWQFALIADRPCRFSTREESATEWPKLTAGSDAAACRIEDVALMGQNAERGTFYELKCSSGEGVIVRFKDGATQQTYSCIDAEQIFRRPCSLTTVETPAAEPAPTGGRA